MNVYHISDAPLSLAEVAQLVQNKTKIALSEESTANIQRCRDFLNDKVKNNSAPIYGITTGFGSLCDRTISEKDLSTLQRNLVISHACGVGEEVPQTIVKLMLLLKIKSVSYGNSGVQVATVQRLIDFYNNDVYPIVYQQGSLGASGDLAPLAHLCLPILGLGEVYFEGQRCRAEEVNAKFGWQAITLQSKEGLALLNGTQFMSAYGVWLVLKGEHLLTFADEVGAMSLDAFDGRIEPFNHLVHDIRPHQGQIETAKNVKSILEGSEIIKREKKHVQDPYSFRCMPQVHGASKDAIRYVKQVVTTEINSVTDNPTVFPNEDIVISAGNFHGQPLALVYDFLALAISEIANISERRIYQLISGKRELPSFLVKNPGLNSGFMIPQYTAASIVSQTKMLCMPCSADSIESSQGQEDHVSMGANAATKAYRIVENVERVLAIELFNAAQALEFRRPLKSSPLIEKIYAAYRQEVPFIENDTIMYELIKKSVDFVSSHFVFNKQ